jgi:pyrroloquinoline quinone (PQQ) biosynthesis protein C
MRQIVAPAGFSLTGSTSPEDDDGVGNYEDGAAWISKLCRANGWGDRADEVVARFQSLISPLSNPSFEISVTGGSLRTVIECGRAALAEEALCRAGMTQAWPALARGRWFDRRCQLVVDLLSPRADVEWGQPPPPRELLDAEEIVRRYEHDVVLANHPFLCRLRREPVSLPRLWCVLVNFWEAIVHDFPARLARVIANLDDDRLRSIFVKQLNDELGEGDHARAHKPMFRRLLQALEPWRMAGDDAVLLAPGRRFGAALEKHLFAADYFEAVGALMMIEVYGKQTDIRLGEEFRRQDQVDLSALEWLHLHESLEVDHADDSLTVAHVMPRAGGGPEDRAHLAAVWRGAEGVVEAGHAYFNDLYRVCWP